jgi:hypothetical protein
VDPFERKATACEAETIDELSLVAHKSMKLGSARNATRRRQKQASVNEYLEEIRAESNSRNKVTS